MICETCFGNKKMYACDDTYVPCVDCTDYDSEEDILEYIAYIEEQEKKRKSND